MVRKVIGSREQGTHQGPSNMFFWIPEKAGSWTYIRASLARLEPQYSTLVSAGVDMWVISSTLSSQLQSLPLFYLSFCPFLVLFLLRNLVGRKGISLPLREVDRSTLQRHKEWSQSGGQGSMWGLAQEG